MRNDVFKPIFVIPFIFLILLFSHISASEFYKEDPTTEKIRDELMSAMFDGDEVLLTLVKKIPQIKVLEKPNNSNDCCHDHSLKKILGFSPINPHAGLPDSQMPGILEKYFSPTSHPKDGDLIVYYNNRKHPPFLTHSGIVRGNGMVESKWGSTTKEVFLHPKFYIYFVSGDEVRYFTPKKSS